MRRSRLRAAGLLVVFLLAAQGVCSQTLQGVVRTSGGRVGVDLTFRWDRAPATVESLQKGLEARIVYTVRLYQRSQSLLGGDRMVAQATFWQSALWDFLDSVYVVESEGGGQTVCADTEELVDAFFTARGVALYDFGNRRHPPLYVTARAQFEPVRLMPPLTLVNLVGAASVFTTPWIRIEAP